MLFKSIFTSLSQVRTAAVMTLTGNNMLIQRLLPITVMLLVFIQSTPSFGHPPTAIDIIAHRGASCFLPEHTKEALVLSFMQGADYIEQDLVATKDRQLVVLHDIHLEPVTNVEQLFPDRARQDGHFYVLDFSLAELRSLSIHERQHQDKTQVFPARYQGKAHFTVATFAEHVELIRELNRLLHKNVGLYPEIKAASWHKKEGIDITKLFIEQIRLLKLDNKAQKMFVQSFEPEPLKELRIAFQDSVNLVQLIGRNSWNMSNTDYSLLKTNDGLAQIASYADGIGPWIPQVIDMKKGRKTDLIERAHAHGLLVHPYTFRTDALTADLSPTEAFTMLKHAGIDGLFTDQIMDFMHQEAKK